MSSEVLGRTNHVFPPVWIRLTLPPISTPEDWVQQLVDAALNQQTVIDISTNPGLWGGKMRGTQATLMTIGGSEIERAPDEQTAFDLTQAHLIQTLSAIGREWIDFYFLSIRRNLEEFQINGALQALDFARKEGHVKFLGLAADGPGLAVQGLWQFRDAFEVILLPNEDSGLVAMAKERRVGVVCMTPAKSAQAWLKRASHPDDLTMEGVSATAH